VSIEPQRFFFVHVSESFRARIAEDNAKDIELHAFAQQLIRERRSEIDSSCQR
jgi:hypothetical protein